MIYTYPTSFTSNTYFKISGFEKRLFSRLGIEPYLPLKSEIVQGLKQENYEGIYKGEPVYNNMGSFPAPVFLMH